MEWQLVEGVLAGTGHALQSRRIDLAIGADQVSRPAGAFTTRSLGRVPFVFAVSADHPLASHQGTLSEQDIARYPAAVAADSSRNLPPGSAGIFRRQQTLTVSNIDQKIALQVAGLGVGWLRRAVAGLGRLRLALGDVGVSGLAVAMCLSLTMDHVHHTSAVSLRTNCRWTTTQQHTQTTRWDVERDEKTA